ncbi:hypothetical protein ZWY2020_057494 [Hordeum vulgare]|nr:hypothetical protein ZWY2020_057494 [Hordeum vulgare]
MQMQMKIDKERQRRGQTKREAEDYEHGQLFSLHEQIEHKVRLGMLWSFPTRGGAAARLVRHVGCHLHGAVRAQGVRGADLRRAGAAVRAVHGRRGRLLGARLVLRFMTVDYREQYRVPLLAPSTTWRRHAQGAL